MASYLESLTVKQSCAIEAAHISTMGCSLRFCTCDMVGHGQKSESENKICSGPPYDMFVVVERIPEAFEDGEMFATTNPSRGPLGYIVENSVQRYLEDQGKYVANAFIASS
jgi:hypothetical protein